MAEKFLVQTPAKFQVIYDPKGKIAGEYDLEGMPSTFIYDRDGKLAIQHLGFLEKEAAGLEAQVVALLEKRAAKPAEEAKDEHSK